MCVRQKEKLVELDEWFQSTLPSALHARDPKPFVTQKELVQLMEWKLKKGKWSVATETRSVSGFVCLFLFCAKE